MKAHHDMEGVDLQLQASTPAFQGWQLEEPDHCSLLHVVGILICFCFTLNQLSLLEWVGHHGHLGVNKSPPSETDIQHKYSFQELFCDEVLLFDICTHLPSAWILYFYSGLHPEIMPEHVSFSVDDTINKNKNVPMNTVDVFC